MTVKQANQKVQHPPRERLASVRIEFADGGIYEVSPDVRVSFHHRPSSKSRAWKAKPV